MRLYEESQRVLATSGRGYLCVRERGVVGDEARRYNEEEVEIFAGLVVFSIIFIKALSSEGGTASCVSVGSTGHS